MFCVLLKGEMWTAYQNKLFEFGHIIYHISNLTDSAGKITVCCSAVMGTDCVSELGGSGAANCVSKSFLTSLSKQLINKTTNMSPVKGLCSPESQPSPVF